MAILNTDQGINESIRRITADFGDEFAPEFLRARKRIFQHLNYELPEIIVVNCEDKTIKLSGILKEIKGDPWLYSGGFVVLHDERTEQEALKMFAGINIVSVIHRARLRDYFPRLLRILSQNRGILFQRDLHFLLHSNFSGSFVLENDPFDLVTYSNLLANFLYNANLIDHERKVRFYVAIMELLINAIEHGNCRITYQEKSACLEDGGDVLALIRKKNSDPEICCRRVYLTYRISPKKSVFKIRDEGAGFDWKTLQQATGEDGLSELHGRGIMMARHYLENLKYNEKGNEVSFEVLHLRDEAKKVPKVFTDQEEVVVQDGETVFTQGEKSSYMYYIVAGEYEIIANDKRVSVLTPQDIFLGEMSFLLDNQRSATVRALGRGVLVKISKESFINAIKERPHYGIFLARLLAQRLVKLHKAATA
ncbi:MAG: cyclic nucleotide-binding domain-containing protein [Spirochaetales bacterium]|nr:cyclic nucleotide-binding domain-containing protein [Spirochaetales bacterium]